jgi:uncharacterized phage-associated protein
MATVFDVAQYILSRSPAPLMDTVKLQKLVFYSHAWHLVATGSPLFEGRIIAHKHGPVACDLLESHARQPRVGSGYFDAQSGAGVSDEERLVLDSVLAYYGSMTGFQLRDLTHTEQPWIASRSLWQSGGDDKIADEDILSFYSRLFASSTKRPVLPKMGITWVLGSEFDELAEDSDSDIEPFDTSALLAAASGRYVVR